MSKEPEQNPGRESAHSPSSADSPATPALADHLPQDSPQSSGEITRQSASNLALAFVLLPRRKRRAMEILYAFCREVDDVADNESVPVEKRKAALREWRTDLDRAYSKSESPRLGVNRELAAILPSFNLQQEDFHALLDGVETDLVRNRFDTWEQLELYCYRVASAVGLLSIPIFGYQHQSARDYAISLGKALQVTNILRDVSTDAEINRIYLPLDDLRTFAVTEADILEGRYSENFRRLSHFYASRALQFYRDAIGALHTDDRPAMIASELMGAVYWDILRKLVARNFNHWDGNGRTRLSKSRKIYLIFRTWLRLTLGSRSPNYGTGPWVDSIQSA